jgi:kynurenine formamidase
MARLFAACLVAAAALVAGLSAAAEGLDPASLEVVDLTHGFGAETIYWPTSPSGFEYRRLAFGDMPGGWFYAAGAFTAPEHGGTHLDAPLHFSASGLPVDRIDVRRLVAPAVVIDVSAQAARDRDYRATREDVLAFEAAHGRVEAGSIALLRTGWSRFWPDRKAYLGDAALGSAAKLSFPSFGAEAAKLLIEERGVAGIGVDTASIDFGRSDDYPVHRLAAGRDVYGLENLANLEALPPRGALLVALPMKIEGGSGAPLRAVALLPRH